MAKRHIVLTPAGPVTADKVTAVLPNERVRRLPDGSLIKELDPEDETHGDLMASSEEYVLTPGGWKPSSRVHHIPQRHVVRMAGEQAELHHEDDGLIQTFGLIPSNDRPEPLMPRAVMAAPPPSPGAALEAVIPAISGWISYTGWTNDSGHPISRLRTTWTVPAEPANRGGQTVFLFNGIQNSTMIYQPVLQWGPSAAGGGQKWSIACWYADGQTGHSFYSTLVDVGVGTELVGTMSLVNQTGSRFDYVAEFDGVAATKLPIRDVEELTWANETLEAYGIVSRNDLPANAETAFSSIELQTGGGPPHLNWEVHSAHPEISSVQVIDGSSDHGDVRIWYEPH